MVPLTAGARGHAAINVKDDTFIINDVSQGVGLYKLSSTDRIKTFEVSTDERLSRNVCFYEGGSTIVIGSDDGRVYVFDRRTGEVGDIIDIGMDEWTQSLAVCYDFLFLHSTGTEHVIRPLKWKAFH
jgi:hypothetical protein